MPSRTRTPTPLPATVQAGYIDLVRDLWWSGSLSSRVSAPDVTLGGGVGSWGPPVKRPSTSPVHLSTPAGIQEVERG